jgi:hypothetical protein
MIAYFAWSAATTDRWNSFDWQMFMARIHSPRASFWDWSLLRSAGKGADTSCLSQSRRGAEANHRSKRKTNEGFSKNILLPSASLRLRESIGCLHPNVKWSSSPPTIKLRAQCEKIACEVEKRTLLVIENGSTSAQRLVQSTILGRAPSKII